MSIFTTMRAQKDQQRRANIENALIHYEAKIGGSLFGEAPKGTRREFFCLDKHTWVWHEEKADINTGKRYSVMTRYMVRPDCVLKSQNGGSYQKISDNELRHLHQAANMYAQRVDQEYSRLLQAA